MGLPRGRPLGRLLRAARLSSGHGRLSRGFEDLESLGGLLGGGALLGILVGSQEGLGSREAFWPLQRPKKVSRGLAAADRPGGGVTPVRNLLVFCVYGALISHL